MKEEIKEKKKFNKKYLMVVLPVLCLVLVSAIGYYAFFGITINHTNPITVNGNPVPVNVNEIVECEDLLECSGSLIAVGNTGSTERTISISNIEVVGIDVSYIGTLELTKKTVNFNLDVWDIPTDADKVQIEYTVVGDEFSAEVVGTPIEGYVLIYYKDNSDRFNEPAEAILVEGNSFPYLPYKQDRNSVEDGTYDYCTTGEYNTCHGAKIWYVPSEDINTEGVISWAHASEYYFESSLIQYNAEGQITVYPTEVLDFTPEFSLDEHLPTGNDLIRITVE